MVPRETVQAHLANSLPRASGDGPFLYWSQWHKPTSPPRERGWSRYRGDGAGAVQVSPARAGMVPRQRHV